MRAGSTCIVDPRHIESGVCFRNMEQQPRGKVFVPVALFSIDHPSILPTLVTYGSDDVQQIAAMTDELLHAKITNVLPDLSNDMTEINLRGTYIG